MDISEIYIKMCEKSVEIQKLRPFEGKVGHNRYYADDMITEVPLYIPNSWNYKHTAIWEWVMNKYDARCKYIWLPRQDQLQEMVGMSNPCMKDYIALENFAFNSQGARPVLPSWEKIWLAFVMKEKYNKVWNGEDWR